MKKISFIVLYILLFSACQSTGKKEYRLEQDDTVKIISSIFCGKELLKDNLNVDTLFFLRNKLFKESWLKSKSRFKIMSLPDNSQTRMTNIGPGFPYDIRQRLSLFLFDYKNDTVKVEIYEHGSNLFYETNLIEKNGKWVIVKQRAYSGGRIDKFEFENEEWYKELRKKIKPHQPMFPPPTKEY